MKYLALILLVLSANANAYMESTTMDGSKIILTLNECEGFHDAYQAFITKDSSVLSFGCWKADRKSIIVLWDKKDLMHYSFKEFKLK